MEPVPAITTSPCCVNVPLVSAATASLVMVILQELAGKRKLIHCSQRSLSNWRSPPATHKNTAAISLFVASIFCSNVARSLIICSLTSSGGVDFIFVPAPSTKASTSPFLVPITARVLVPPPSTPIMYCLFNGTSRQPLHKLL